MKFATGPWQISLVSPKAITKPVGWSRLDSTPSSSGKWKFTDAARSRSNQCPLNLKSFLKESKQVGSSYMSMHPVCHSTQAASGKMQQSGPAAPASSSATAGTDTCRDSQADGMQPRQASTSGRQFNSMQGRRSQERQAAQSVADKLIAVFASKSPAEWRKLIAFSQQWPTLAESLFERLDDRLAKEVNISEKATLKKLVRRLRSVHAELTEYNDLLQSFTERGTHEWESVVAANRPSFTSEFFQHCENLVKAAHDDVEVQEDLAERITKILALVTAFDQVNANQEAMQDAALQFDSLLQVSSLEEADTKIDQLAASGKLDPALLLTMAKAYAAAKETDKTQEEVKDIMAHLYFKAKESFAKMQPPEIRILKHLLSLDDPQQRAEELRAAFEPGPDLETATQDFLSTTSEKLLAAIELILGTYEKTAGSASMVGQAGALMSPEIIKRLKDIQVAVQKDFV